LGRTCCDPSGDGLTAVVSLLRGVIGETQWGPVTTCWFQDGPT